MNKMLRKLPLHFCYFFVAPFLMLPAFFSAHADMIGHGGMVRTVSVSPNGKWLLTGSFDNTARLWDFGEQTELAVLDEHTAQVNAVAFLPDGSMALTASDDRTVILWDLETRKPVRKFIGHTHKIVSVAVSPDGETVSTGGWDRTVRVWNLSDGKQLQVIKHPTPINAVVFTDNETVVSGGHDGKLRIWNTRTGLARGKLPGHEMAVTQMSVSGNGSQLLTAGIDGRLKLWNLKQLKEIRSFSVHEGQIYATAISADGSHALSAGRDGAVVLWNLAAGKPIRTIKAHDQIVWSVALTPDGRFGISTSSDESIRVWHLDSGNRIGIPDEGAGEPKPWLTSSHPGARLFRKCAKCHSLSADGVKRSGPHFAGLFGRRAGSIDGYKYSEILQQANFVWEEETLSALFTRGPDKYLPGTKMPVQIIPDPRSLKDLISYLRELTSPK